MSQHNQNIVSSAPNSPQQKGFTIVELVIVMAIIAILAAVLILTFSTIILAAETSSAKQLATYELKAYLLDKPNAQGICYDNELYYLLYFEITKGDYLFYYRYGTKGTLEEIEKADYPDFSFYNKIEGFPENPVALTEDETDSCKVVIYKKVIPGGHTIYYVERPTNPNGIVTTELILQPELEEYYILNDDCYSKMCLTAIDFGEPTPTENDQSLFQDSQGILYKSNGDGTAYTYSYSGIASELSIPSYLSNGDRVTHITSKTFQSNKYLEKITLSEGIEVIQANAFYACGNLNEITIPSSLKKIDNNAFKFTKLASILLPSSCEISSGAFSFITEIRFMGDTPHESENYLIVNGATIEKSTGKLIAFFSKSNDVVIPENVGIREIGNNCFSYTPCKTVTLPSSLEVIGDYGFYACESLITVANNANLKKLGINAFCDCKCLVNFDLTSSSVSLGKGAFVGCTSLDVVLDRKFEEGIYNSVKSITLSPDEQDYFLSNGCVIRKKDNVIVMGTSYCTLPTDNDAKVLGTNAFEYCLLPKVFVFPDNIEEIKANCFYYARLVESITLNDNIKEIGNQSFFRMVELKTLVVNCAITTLPSHFCASCTKLETVRLPASIKTIETKAFANCPSLKIIYFDGTVQEWKQINFASDWHSATSSFKVICNDGEVGYLAS